MHTHTDMHTHKHTHQEISKGHIKCSKFQHFLKLKIKFLQARHAGLVCHVIQLFCSSLRKISQATKTLMEPFPVIYATFATPFFFMLDSLWCTNQSFDVLDLMCTAQILCISVTHWLQIWCIWHPFSMSDTHICGSLALESVIFKRALCSATKNKASGSAWSAGKGVGFFVGVFSSQPHKSCENWICLS